MKNHDNVLIDPLLSWPSSDFSASKVLLFGCGLSCAEREYNGAEGKSIENFDREV
jgi:hypothetical protein